MTSGYYCAIFPFCGGGKKKDDKKTKAFYDWATTGIPVMNYFNQLISCQDSGSHLKNFPLLQDCCDF